MLSRDRKILTIILAGLAVGCSEYLDRRETLSIGSGDAVAANKAIQTIDPWSIASRDRRHITHGERTQLAIDRYKTNTSIPPQGLGTSSAEFEQTDSSASAAPATQ